MNKHLVPVTTVALIFAGAALRADSSLGWRADGTGRYPDATPPTTWAADKNIVWKTQMPATSNATPIIVKDRIFVCAEPSTLVCVALADGAILWQKTNSYLDVISPEEAEKAKQDDAKAAEVRPKMQAIEKELNEKRTEIDKMEKAKKAAAAPAPVPAPAPAPPAPPPPAGAAPPPAAAAPATPPPPMVDEAVLAAAKTRLQEIEKTLAPLKQEYDRLGTWRLPPTNDVNGYASCTPVSDGTNVYVLFGNGVAACYDLEGNRKWARCVEKPRHDWGHSTSPVLAGDKLLVHLLRLNALNASTGETLWTFDAGARWGTPVIARLGGADVAVTPSGDFVRVADGKPLARNICGLEFNAPVVAEGVAYFIQNGGKAVKLPATAAAEFTPEVLWTTTPPKERYYASPLYHDGLIYDLTQQQLLSVIDAKTGTVIYSKELKLGGTAYPSVTLAGRYVYVGSDSGATVVLEPGREYKELARNKLEPFRASPVFAGKRLYIRGLKHLYCIEELSAPAPVPAPAP